MRISAGSGTSTLLATASPESHIMEKLVHRVQLTDHLYSQAREAAAAAGFESVDLFVAEAVRGYLQIASEDEEAMFTPEVLAEIDKGVEDVIAGRTLSGEEVDARLAKHKAKWLEERAS